MVFRSRAFIIFVPVVSKTKASLNLMDPKPVGQYFLLKIDPIGSVNFVIKLLTWLPPQYHNKIQSVNLRRRSKVSFCTWLTQPQNEYILYYFLILNDRWRIFTGDKWQDAEQKSPRSYRPGSPNPSQSVAC